MGAVCAVCGEGKGRVGPREAELSERVACLTASDNSLRSSLERVASRDLVIVTDSTIPRDTSLSAAESAFSEHRARGESNGALLDISCTLVRIINARGISGTVVFVRVRGGLRNAK